MSVFSDASSVLGVPAWAVSACIGVLALAKLAEGSMRPEAKAEIGAFLDRGSIDVEALDVTRAVTASFTATFGERQWSWRCLSRTLLLSVFATYAIALLIWSKHGGEIRAHFPELPSVPIMIANSVIVVLLSALWLNWLSVGKTRLILRGAHRIHSLWGLFAIMLLDVLLTYVLSTILYWGPRLLESGTVELCETARYYDAGADCSSFAHPLGVLAGIVSITIAMTERIWSQAGSLTPNNILNYSINLSAQLTSIWTVLIVGAMTILRLLVRLAWAPRLIRRGWDLRSSPIMAMGWIIAVLVWIGALAYALI
jgi:hypothetical protein